MKRRPGTRLVIVYGSVEPQRDLIAKGEVADIVITSRVLADDLVKRGRTAEITEVARITIRLFVGAGARKPDISTVEALKASLLKAESVAFTNPARGALAGRSFANALKRMGIYDQVLERAKIIPGLGHDVVAAVARGEAAIGAGPTNRRHAAAEGDRYPRSAAEGTRVRYPDLAAILANAPSPDAAAAFIKFMRSPPGAAALTGHGLEP